MYKAGRTLVAIAFACLVVVPLALAQTAARAAVKAGSSSMEGAINALFGARTFDQTAISPDAKQVAWVEVTKEGSAIFVSAVTGGAPRRVTAGGKSESALAWSPDSKQVAFLSDATNAGQPQLYVASAAGGSPRAWIGNERGRLRGCDSN